MTFLDNLDSEAYSIKNKKTEESLTKVNIKKELVSIYQPNFVLVKNDRIVTQSGSAIFSDIVPLYSSYQKLTEVIVSSWESLQNFILSSKLFIVCILSFLNQIINSVTYQSYLMVASSYETIQSLPDKYKKAKLRLSNFVEIMTDSQNRSLWWLEVKIRFRSLAKKASKSLILAANLSKKLYLSILIVSALGSLAFIGASTTSTTNSSPLQEVVNSNSYVDASKVSLETGNSEIADDLSVTILDDSNQEAVSVIKSHQVQEGETIENIAALYGLEEDTLIFNNGLEKGADLEVGKDIYLPWIDGYIYHATDDISVSDLAEIYHIDDQKIEVENPELFKDGNKNITKNSLVLIPLGNFDVVAKYNEEEKERQEEVKKENERKRVLAQSAYRVSCSVPSSSKIPGFIWPVRGQITQCYHGGHKAVDISGSSASVISAVKSGTVVEAAFGFNHGYGNKVTIDHGNGYKTVYAHLSTINVQLGQTVTAGQGIGNMGCSGNSYGRYDSSLGCHGTHLHFEIYYNGKLQNPFFYLP